MSSTSGLWMTSCLPTIVLAKEIRVWRVLKLTYQQAALGQSLISTIDLFFPLLLQLYHQQSIYLVLVGLEVWIDGDRITVNSSDHIQTLHDFSAYRWENINAYHNNDNAQLLTYVMFVSYCIVHSFLPL